MIFNLKIKKMNEKPQYYQIHYLSQVYLDNAIFLSEKCKEIEELKKNNSGHCAYFYGSFFNCISCLESNINENYIRLTGDFRHPKFQNINIDNLNTIKSMWQMGIPRTAAYSTLDKYQLLLTLCNKKQIDKSRNPYQNTSKIISLRNFLIHYEPEMRIINEVGFVEKLKIEKIFENIKFPLSPFTNDETPLFLSKIISYSFLNWVINTIVEFLKEFEERLKS